MDYNVYLLIHLFGIFTVLAAAGSLAYREAVGGPGGPGEAGARKLIMVEHGLGLLLMLVSGFGLLAKLEIHGVPGWAWVKIAVWLLLGAAPFLIRRFFRGSKALVFWALLPILAIASGYLAKSKPF